MKTLTPGKLVALLQGMSGALPVGIEAETDARLLKTGNPFKNCLKYIRAVGFCGASYEKAVKREGDRQGVEADFKAQGLPWQGAEWVIPNKVLTYKGDLYLRVQSSPGQRKRQPAKVLSYRANGEFVDYEKVKPFIPEKSESKRQQEAGLDETIHVRTYKFSSLKKVRIGGTTYELVNNDPIAKPAQPPRKRKSGKKSFDSLSARDKYAGLGHDEGYEDYKAK
jgi:hypothetical protein